MKILVRLPNWLGDMIMSLGFMNQLPVFFPNAEVSVIAKKGIHPLLKFFPSLKHCFVFSKEEYKGMKGLRNFGEEIKNTENFDLFFCLPNSFSSAIMGYFTGAKKRVGYKNEIRQLFLTNSFDRPENVHRADEYVNLLELYTQQSANSVKVKLNHQFEKKEHVVININSEASSRRLTINKAIELIDRFRTTIKEKIFLIGSPQEKEFVDAVFNGCENKAEIENVAGKTSLTELVELLASAKLMLTTDSGPAHLANALCTKTIVLFGAGNEMRTAPYNKENRTVIRLGQLSCEPCEKNICVRFGIPQCLEQLDSNLIVETAKQQLYG